MITFKINNPDYKIPPYQKQIIVRFKKIEQDSIDLCGHTFVLNKSTTSHSPEEQIPIDESFHFPRELEYYSTLVKEGENIEELLKEIAKDPNVEMAFESFPPAPPPF